VLLSKTWDNETVADIKEELKKRGLSLTGNKATLVTRITESERRNERNQSTPSTTQVPIRHASAGSTPGRPTITTRSVPNDFLTTRLPDLSQPLEDSPVQIPFAPDHWESESSKAKPDLEPAEPSLPKVLTVTLPTTLVGGGPSHNVYQMSDDPSPSPGNNETSLRSSGGFLTDVMNDLGLPSSIKTPTVHWQFSETPASSKNSTKTYSRDLDSNEVWGVWALLGLFAGSWVLGGIFKPASELDQAEKSAEIANL